MTNTKNIEINSIYDSYKREEMIPAITDVLMNNFDYYDGNRYISREFLFGMVLNQFDVNDEVRNQRYVTPNGAVGDYCLFKGLDLSVKALRDAGCLIDKKGTNGKYNINKDIYRYLKERGNEAIESIIKNFNEGKTADLATEYVTKNPQIKGVLIKKAS